MRPIIGITGNFGTSGCEVAEAYYLSVAHAGAVPFILPPLLDADAEHIDRTLDGIDGLLLSGGADVNPLLLGEEPLPGLRGINVRRDRFELALVRRAYQRQIPILGICRGIQVLAAALGGTVHQDIPEPRVKHSQDAERWCATHTINIIEGTLLGRIFDRAAGAEGRLAVNSFHHQAVATPGERLRVSATAADGVIEAVESCECKPIIGVQWHPESFELVGDHCMMPLFRWLSDEALLHRRTQRLHDRIISLDSHEDTPMLFDRGIDFQSSDPQILVSMPLMMAGRLDCGIQAAYQAQGPLDDDSLLAATQKAHALLDGIDRMSSERVSVVSAATDGNELAAIIRQNKSHGRVTILKAIENGYAFGADLGNIERFRQRGVVYCTLCHNGNNQICDSARPKDGDRQWGGLSPYGRSVVGEMNRCGMTIDLSHASEATFYDTLEASGKPVVCSHSNARSLCDHPRNLTDEQLRALAAQGGVAQMTLYHGFLRADGPATIYDAIAHLEHLINIMGIDHVGVGTDLDGDGGVSGLANAGELCNLTRELLRRGYSADDLFKIWGLNFLRVLGA